MSINEELCIENEELCIENEEFCSAIDTFDTHNDTPSLIRMARAEVHFHIQMMILQ